LAHSQFFNSSRFALGFAWAHFQSPQNPMFCLTDSRLDGLFHRRYIPLVEWEVEFTHEFGEWWNNLSADEQEDVDAVVGVLEEKGPSLRRPYVSPIAQSKHSNMKELIVQHAGRAYRVGGDKTGNERWYDEFVPIADRLYDEHLQQLKKDGLI
jgi:hypothetical protein